MCGVSIGRTFEFLANGVCPGNHRSAGKEKDPHINHGNRWLRTALVECAWAASVKKNAICGTDFGGSPPEIASAP